MGIELVAVVSVVIAEIIVDLIKKRYPQVLNVITRLITRQPQTGEEKWYQQDGVIESGLIEITLALTAVVVALPAFIGEEISAWHSVFRIFYILGIGMSAVASIRFLNLYVKERSPNPNHVLICPADGPFCLLSWAVVVGLLTAIVIVGYPLSEDIASWWL